MTSRTPSPSMVVACLALVMATTGTAVAAVSFATNAGAVDGKSAVAHGATRAQAAGKLVATARTGTDRGRIDQRYLDAAMMRGASGTFGRSFEVADNATLAPAGIGSIPGLGALTATCNDQSQQPGREDPQTTITFANGSGDVVNFSRTVGASAPLIGALAAGTQGSFTISGSNTFELHIQRKGTNYFVRGVVRQDGKDTPAAACTLYGFALVMDS